MSEYPQQEKANRLLELMNKELKKAHERGSSEVQFSFSTGDAFGDQNGGLFFEGARREGIGDKLGISNAEALSLFRRLGDEGYLSIDFGKEKNKPFGLVKLLDLGSRGYEQIGEHPNPRDELLRRLDAIEEAIRSSQDPNVPQEQREAGIKAIGALKQIGMSASGSGVYDAATSILDAFK